MLVVKLKRKTNIHCSTHSNKINKSHNKTTKHAEWSKEDFSEEVGLKR